MKRLLLALAVPFVMSCSKSSEDIVSPNAFTDGLVAIVDNVEGAGWPRDGLTIESATISGDTLRLSVRHGGGCARHRFALLINSAFMESFPVQVHARIAHDADGDVCDALITRTLSFDLTRLQQRYKSAYGPGSASIVIHLVGQGQSVRYRFD
jgi:hypothetical protein